MSPKTKRVTKSPGTKPPSAKKSFKGLVATSDVKINEGFKFKRGQPTKYEERFCEMVIEHSKKLGGTLESFAVFIAVHRMTLNEWARVHKDFSIAMAVAKQTQQEVMMKLGLAGMLGKNGSGSWQGAWIFAMKARFGMREDGPVDEEETNLKFDLEDIES